jgi:hypothetical protein
MKKQFGRCMLLVGLLLAAGCAAMAQQAVADNLKNNKTKAMKMYLIEREIPGAGKMTPEQLKAASQTSNSVLKEMGPTIQWIQSYVLGNKLVCVYKAENEDLIREHAKRGGFPANTITEVANIINPATGH